MMSLQPRSRLACVLAGSLFLASVASAQDKSPPTLKAGDTGPAVDGLQRALNARLTPSPDLSVDGDFGDGTRAALIRFQRSKGLAPSGVADAATREALGPPPPPTDEPPVLRPEVVNARKLARKPADAADAPPFVTSLAWAIADGKTGERLWGFEDSTLREPASTTKIMTALVVLRQAKIDPKVLDEVVTFSDRADRTTGSTSGVKAGERVSVRELLYGLLLPSGNDAAEALAEHFSPRFPATLPVGPTAGFLAEMNRLASELGLRETHYANPHGLPDPTHRSSARDLARLTAVAMTDPTFAAISATRERGATLVDASGKSRDIVWSNTNRLLEVDGYDGVKTGTTSGAGACLVASGHRGEDRLIVVVLGAATSEGRYVDARNLFRWAWNRPKPPALR